MWVKMRSVFSIKQWMPTFGYSVLMREFLAALLVASTVSIISYFGLNRDLEIDALNLVGAWLSINKLPEFEEGSGKTGNSQVVMINNRAYEAVFNQSSPLDREKLKAIISDILFEGRPPSKPPYDESTHPFYQFEGKPPKVLAIDLDLSPGPNDAPTHPLYQLLRESTQTQIVLIFPQAVYTRRAIDVKSKWVLEMCKEQHIHFASPYIPSSGGSVLRYWSATSAFANQVKAAFEKASEKVSENKKGREGGDLCLLGEDNLKIRLNALLKDLGIEQKEKEPEEKEPEEKEPEEKLLNFKFPSAIYLQKLDLQAGPEKGEASSLSLKNNIALKDQVVFLGGSYGTSDRYETPVGEFFGVYLHAASYFSLLNDVSWLPKKAIPFVEYLAAIFLSMFLGLTFFKLYAFLAGKTFAVAMFTHLLMHPVLIMIFLFVSALILYHCNLWLDSALLVIGTEIYSKIIDIDGPNADKPTVISHIPQRIRLAVYSLIVGCSWVLLAVEIWW